MSSLHRLYFSCNLTDLDRGTKLCEELKKKKFPFTDTAPSAQLVICEAEISKALKIIMWERMMKSDYLLLMADRYKQYYRWVELEIACACILDIPIVVLQPWSCWSIPKPLSQKAWKILQWDAKILIDTLQSSTEAQAT